MNAAWRPAVISNPVWRWARIDADIERSSGPERTQQNPKPDTKFRRRPVGFTADLDAETEPLTWGGDDA